MSLQREIFFIDKWNPCKSPLVTIAAKRVADTNTARVSERASRCKCLRQKALKLAAVGRAANPARRVYLLNERTIDKHGNNLLLPPYALEAWTTMLPERFGSAQVNALYCDHATQEQLNSEFKSDMDLKRQPSEKFDTDSLVYQLATVTINLLRLARQSTLNDLDAPVRIKAKQYRINTVMQELMFKATWITTQAKRWVLGLGRSDPAFAMLERYYEQPNTAQQRGTVKTIS